MADISNIFSFTEEEIKKIDCNNCKYSFYDPNDKHEYQKCEVIGMKEKPPINRDVLELIHCDILSEFGCCACEYFDFK